MPLSRMENTTFAMPSIIDSHDMGLRTVYSPDAQKKTPNGEKPNRISRYLPQPPELSPWCGDSKWEEKKAETQRDLRHIHKKVELFPSSPIGRLRTTFSPPPDPGTSISGFRIPKSNAQRGNVFSERKKKEKLAASPIEKATRKPKNSAHSSSVTAKS
ncbi:hypothetical protein TNCV_4208061 [Trichonephila clavipes]|nr:hypothetical protein TNCV_4208061 [Trichonephila clavipes]